MKYLISPHKKQYKANLHCHSILSDGRKTPEELKEMYKSHGYSILAITDHERPVQHQDLADPDFLPLTGYECYIRPDPKGRYDIYAKEVHLNLFARDPMNEKLVCCNEWYCRYLKRDNAMDSVQRVGSERPREYSREYINEYIRTAKEYGYIVAYNHPYWSMEDEADILSYEGLFSFEMCNYNSYVVNYLEHNGMLYDKMLTAKMHIACHSGDDNHNAYPLDHPNSDSFGAFTMICPEEFTYDSVIDAMEKGEMYSSMGPMIHEVSMDGNRIHIECSEVSHIFVYMGSKKPACLHAAEGENLTSADFDLNPYAKYVRVSVLDSKGRWADTRGFFPEELELHE
ncbi:MAG: hypothetical protein E7658_08100 [Ruminococcaceae bacterium]|nr:hypothetical protein [Oscillospiraceae bacterium]